jgi:hypothetical protein
MAKYPTFPTLLDEVKTLTLTNLKKWGYLGPSSIKQGTVFWSWRGERTSSIGITVNTLSALPYLELNYTCQGQPVLYKVHLTQIPANIGRGQVWYFVCPKTQRLCRTLYMVGSKFLHRLAYTGPMYESQTKSHKDRTLIRLLDKVFGVDKLNEQLHTKHFKTTYAGKPTKRFQAIQRKLKQAERVNPQEVEQLLYSR